MIKILTGKRSAFTLVELLVVIAIIGLLSTIVLVSFGPIRNQAADTAIKANLNQIRLAAEMQYNTDSSYADTDLRADYLAAVAAITAAGGAFTPAAPATAFLAGSWCIQSTLKTSGSWCLDSAGRIGSTNVSCDATLATCN